jgi:hypothetical protein
MTRHVSVVLICDSAASASAAATGMEGGVTGTVGVMATSSTRTYPTSTEKQGGAGRAWNVESSVRMTMVVALLSAIWM